MKAQDARLQALEQRIGYVFTDRALAREALTHASALDSAGTRRRSYQRLEFLGDRVLGLARIEQLDGSAASPVLDRARWQQAYDELQRASLRTPHGPALTVLQSEPDRRARLWENRRRLFEGLTRLGYRMTDSASPIIPLIVGTAESAVALADQLLLLGVYAPAVRPPTVPPDTSRIRVTVTSEHTPSHLETALEAFRVAGHALGLI